MTTEHQQMGSLKPEGTETSDISPINLGLKVDNNQAEKIEKEEYQSVHVEDDYEDEAVTVLAFWFGDPKLDVLTAEEWIGSVQKAKDQSKWNDEVTMANVVNALYGDALEWFLDLVTTLSTSMS